MKWKRSRKAKEQALTSSPTDIEKNRMDAHKPQSDSQSSDLEDEEEIDGEDVDEKEEIEVMGGDSLSPVVFMRHAGRRGAANYSSYSEEELEEGGLGTRSTAFQ